MNGRRNTVADNSLPASSASTAAIAPALAVSGILNAYGVRDGQIEISGRRADVVFGDTWLTIDLPTRVNGRGPRRLLELNSSLPGAKHVLLTDGTWRLRSEIPIHADTQDGPGELTRLIRFAFAGLQVPANKTRRSAAPALSDGKLAASTRELERLCEESGWPFSHRASGGLSVDLETAGGTFLQAAVVPEQNYIRQSVQLLREGESPADDTAELAISVLLLAATASVRMVRGVSYKTDHGRVFGLEVGLPASPSLDLFVDGLSSLSLACSLAGQEVRALAEDTALAQAFLEIRHPRILNRHRRRRDGRRSSGRSPSAEVFA